jgi:hypothetical protein
LKYLKGGLSVVRESVQDPIKRVIEGRLARSTGAPIQYERERGEVTREKPYARVDRPVR